MKKIFRRLFRRFQRKCEVDDFAGLSEADFREIASILTNGQNITPHEPTLAQWRDIELRVQLAKRWRQPDSPTGMADFELHAEILRRAILPDGDSRGGYSVYCEAFKRAFRSH